MATIVITGPSAIGKTFLANTLLANYGDYFEQAKLVTTRQPRLHDPATDREFVNADTFASMEKNGEFAAVGMFHNNQYGYRHDIFAPRAKHMLVNVWPEFLLTILKQDNTQAVVLTASTQSLTLLESRMLARGDDAHTVAERKKLIIADIATLEKICASNELQGKVFTIQGDDDIYDAVIPWILAQYTAIKND